MVMNMTCVQMSCHHALEPVAPQPSGKLHTDGMGFIRRDLACLKALVGMQGYDTAGLAKPELGRVKLIPRKIHVAVYPRCVEQLVRLIFIRRMFVKTTLRYLENRLRYTV